MTKFAITPRTRIVVEDYALVDQVYSGKPGCCCGCLGNYSESARSIRSHITRTNALLAAGEVSRIESDFEDGVFIETDTRYRNIYIHKDRARIAVMGDLIVITATNGGGK
jgi:hypothetical protein